MNKVKLIASDLDGTLLNERAEVSDETAQAIKRAQKAGISVVVVSGRSYSFAKAPLQEAGLNCPIISLNGAETYDEEGTLLTSVPLDKNVASKVDEVCSEHGLYYEMFTNKGGFSTDYERFLTGVLDIFKSANTAGVDDDTILQFAKKRFREERIELVNDFSDVIKDNTTDIYKILTFSMDNHVLNTVRERFKETPELVMTTSAKGNLEFNAPMGQKGYALAHFARTVGIDMSDVMALGDHFNDVSMLQMAGVGVAMGNAEDGIKQICRYQTIANKEHGVAHAIQKALEGKLEEMRKDDI
ncbi:HAD family phosphatase [Salipaludibacillus agaradhaerens]|uniref:HAD family phosphatase n=1 Tax=Salipaludibacillus agaradhaerens TaxID=76935 RepID=A0A9Q4G1E2_SALAG|nr:Cof-type HAD-IIB family hydrolase [Salipaludibacillus agaradhaerens]MCR6098764.1 HAD family phosphatase [Salipaludibacillus agaradhaerens]MCR6115771.1 HAD family phosphatase [Salipaludibacillus agaradhaerens]